MSDTMWHRQAYLKLGDSYEYDMDVAKSEREAGR